MSTFYCIKCGRPKDSTALQPTTDERDRWRLGLCDCTKADSKGSRHMVAFAATPTVSPLRAKWGHGDGATQYCEECQRMATECSDPKPAPGSMLCYCGHNIQKR